MHVFLAGIATDWFVVFIKAFTPPLSLLGNAIIPKNNSCVSHRVIDSFLQIWKMYNHKIKTNFFLDLRVQKTGPNFCYFYFYIFSTGSNQADINRFRSHTGKLNNIIVFCYSMKGKTKIEVWFILWRIFLGLIDKSIIGHSVDEIFLYKHMDTHKK